MYEGEKYSGRNWKHCWLQVRNWGVASMIVLVFQFTGYLLLFKWHDSRHNNTIPIKIAKFLKNSYNLRRGFKTSAPKVDHLSIAVERYGIFNGQCPCQYLESRWTNHFFCIWYNNSLYNKLLYQIIIIIISQKFQ